MTKTVTGRVCGRRSRGIIPGANHAALELLVDIARAVSGCEELCGCGHSDARTCFLTAKKRKALFLQTHHSLLLQNPRKNSPIKLVIKQQQPVKQPPAAVEVSVSPPAPPPAAIAPVFVPLPLALPLPAPSVNFAALPAVPVGFAAQEEDLPLSLKARVSARVGGEGVCALGSKFSLVIRKQLTATDLNPHHSRLNIPGKRNTYRILQLLTEEEKSELAMGVKVKLGFFLDPELQIASPNEGSCLGVWKNGKSHIFTLIGGGWRWVLKEQRRLNMKSGVEIELWSFRTVDSGELCFVLVTSESVRRAAIGGIGNGGYDEVQVVEQEAAAVPVAVAAMERIDYASPMDSGSNSSTLTHEEEEQPVLDLTLRL